MTGDGSLFVEARTALLDALVALEAHRDSVILVGAQAVYLRTGDASFAIAPATKDSDLAIDPRRLAPDPHLEDAMTRAGFVRDLTSKQPGAWLSPRGIPVDLMVPEQLAGARGRRSVKIPPHAPFVARRATGLEAAVVDHSPMVVTSLAGDGRSSVVNVAGPAALLVAKLHKLGERLEEPSRLNDKDAHDSYRILVATPTHELAEAIRRLLRDNVAEAASRQALGYLERMFAGGPEALGAVMAGRAEFGVGQPDVVAASAAFLTQDLLQALSDVLGAPQG